MSALKKSHPTRMEGFAASITQWSEKWFPDSYIFALFAVLLVSLGALLIGAPIQSIGISFGNGFWDLIPFTLQMAMVSISGYVVATSPPIARLIDRMAQLPRNGRSAVAGVAFVAIFASLINWALSLVLSGLFVKALARRKNLKMDYRAAGASAYLGLGATWALGLSSSAAQLQANPESIPKNILNITGVIPFKETIFLPQSILMLILITLVSIAISYLSAPRPETARTAEDLGMIVNKSDSLKDSAISRPGDWFEQSPFFTILIAGLGLIWLVNEFQNKDLLLAISNLNTYNFLFLILGMILHWRPRRFLDSVAHAVPATAGVLIQFPLYGSIAAILTKTTSADGNTLAHQIANSFVAVSTTSSFPILMGIYSAILGFFVPSGGGKWIIEAPYLMSAANDLQVHLGWTVQIYNAAEALPNLINPFWMLPLLGILGLKARDLMGYTFIQFVIHVPFVLALLWILAQTLTYHPPSF